MVSDDFRASAYAAADDEVWLVLLTISSDELTDDLRVVNNNENIRSNGETFYACPFEPQLPKDTDDGPPTARLRIDNISQDLVQDLREVDSGVSVKMEVIRAAEPDTIEQTFDGFLLKDIVVNEATITGTLALEDLTLEKFPARSFSPGNFPAIF